MVRQDEGYRLMHWAPTSVRGRESFFWWLILSRVTERRRNWRPETAQSPRAALDDGAKACLISGRMVLASIHRLS